MKNPPVIDDDEGDEPFRPKFHRSVSGKLRFEPFQWVCGNPHCKRGEGGKRCVFMRTGPQGTELCPGCNKAALERDGKSLDPEVYWLTRDAVKASKATANRGAEIHQDIERDALKRARDGERINPKLAARWLNQFFD